MASASPARAAALSAQFQRACFGCGVDNPHGLQLQFRLDPDGTVEASWIPDTKWEGLQGIVHGGIITTLLDEAMARAVATAGCKSMTADLRVRFREYAKTGEPLRVRGWVVKRRRRLIEAEATVVAHDGSERAHAWATFLAVVKPSTSAQVA